MRRFSTWLLLAAALTLGVSGIVHAQDSFGGPRKMPAKEAPKPTLKPTLKRTPTADGARAGGAPGLDQLTQMERADYGIPASRMLYDGEMHGPTPSSIPGGQVVTTQGMLDLQRRKVPHVIIDVLGAPEQLPNAVPGVWLAQPGSFTDPVQTRAVQLLQQVTQGQRDVPLIFYCRSPYCWMSYNAALRAINAGYSNVLWYRGGVESWKMAGQR